MSKRRACGTALILGACSALVWIAVWPQAAAVQATRGPRAQRAQAAERLLAGTSLFVEGRGLHSVPHIWRRWAQVMPAFDHVPPVRAALSRVAADRWGLLAVGPAINGVVDREYDGVPVAATTCLICHSGKAAGRYYIGLGNKNIDVAQLGRDGFALMRLWSSPRLNRGQSDTERQLVASALDTYARLGDTDHGNLTQGLVAISFIKSWFYRVNGQPVPPGLRRQQVKVPAFWGYGAKEHVGKFADGFGEGPGWLAMVELAAGQSPSAVLRQRDVLERLNAAIGDLLPPVYPFQIDTALVRSGQAVFRQHCERCHGRYTRDPDGGPLYEPPRRVDWSIVRTDPDRLATTDSEFAALVDSNPLRSLIRRGPFADRPPAYVAPRLNAIWARFPYLHNGSVPTIDALLAPQDQRPAIFDLHDAGEAYRFDSARLGLTVPSPGSIRGRALAAAARRDSRAVYDTRRDGHSNRGHLFGTGLSESAKRALIEFLKTL